MRNMKAALREVLLEKEVKEELTATFSKQVEEITGHLEQRINFIEEENARREEDDTKRDEKLHELEAKLDKHEQATRNPRIIITGLHANDMMKESMISKMNEVLGNILTDDDVDWVQKLVVQDGGNQRKNKLRVTLKSMEKKREIFKAKTRLKGQNLWITDDLTPFGSCIAYEARQAVKNGTITKTWVYDSKIFIVKKGDDRPKRVFVSKDIPK